MNALRAAGRTDQVPSLFLHRPGRTENSPSDSPAAPGPGATTPGRLLARLIESLLAYPLMSDRDERQALVNELPAAVVARMPRHTMPRTDVIGIVRTVRAQPDRLWELYDAVTLLDDEPGRAADLRAAVQDFIAGPGPGL